jgi:hypothetical protein
MAKRRFSPIRFAIILLIGGVAIFAADWYRRSLRPAPAPPEVQQRGGERVKAILARVAASEFGQSPRGKALAAAIERFLARGRLIFSAAISPQALYRREFLGHEALYVKVIALGGKLAVRDDELIAEGIFHEAVHALRGGSEKASIEEECDGSAAGLAAGAAVTGARLPDLLLIDGRPVADFVRREYPGNPRRPDYLPVGETRDWLLRRTGLR